MDPFKPIPNSFYASVFGKRDRPDIEMPSTEKMDTLSAVSALYLYTNPPPNGTGTPAPKVAESVLRAYNFNHKTENRTAIVDGYEVDNPVWTSAEPFPYDRISSNFEPGILHKMTREFLKANYEDISETAERVMDKICTMNSDELTKGKQTWDPFEERSVPCPQAYSKFCDVLVKNGYPDNHTMLELVKYWFDLMNRQEMISEEVRHCSITRKRRIDGQSMETKSLTKKVKVCHKKGEEVYRHVIDLTRSFCSYIKHGERAHLERRAIASTGIAMRALFYIGEEFHLELGKRVKGSTISIGGELKKVKISSLTSECKGDPQAIYAFQATQDATKWNECLSAQGFGMFSKTLFDPEVREELGLPLPTPSETLLREICMASHWLLAIKMITLGNGLQGHTDLFHGEIPFKEKNLHKYNQKTQKWFRETIPFLYGNNYMRAPGGMLMGMHNALSTTYGLVSVGFDRPMTSNMYTLRSSDDSMTIYTAPTAEPAKLAIIMERVNLKRCGINMSDKKSFVFELGFGEYTSWYQDGNLVSQYGAEATRMRPSGMNPPDDFYNIAKSTANSLMNLESNPIGAEAKIRIGISNVRNLYRIKRRSEEDLGHISAKVRVLSDGGLNPWNSTNCHMEETSLKKRFVSTEIEDQYFLKIRNPNNPFSGPPTEEVNWSKETGGLTVSEVDTPRTIFHYVKRANSTVKNLKGKTHAQSEKDHAKALEILQSSDPTLLLKVPGNTHKTSDHVIGSLLTSSTGMELDSSERRRLERAIMILRNGVPDNGDDDLEEFLYDDDF